jgi:hypothetical protein
MKTKTGCSMVLSACAAIVLAIATVPSTLAQCGLPAKLVKPSSWQPQVGVARVMRAALANEKSDDGNAAAIVGMWHVTFTAQTSNGDEIPAPGVVIDNALAVWHSDGTEIMNSVRPPQDGNFCMGVWEQTERSTYYLNHFAWFANQFPNNTDNGIGMPVGPTHITETVMLSPDCNRFSGTFTLTAYDESGKTVVQTFTGAISGTRITTTTTEGDLL